MNPTPTAQAIKELACSRCQRRIVSLLTYDSSSNLMDSTGCVLFDDETVCDECLYDAHGHHPAENPLLPWRATR